MSNLEVRKQFNWPTCILFFFFASNLFSQISDYKEARKSFDKEWKIVNKFFEFNKLETKNNLVFDTIDPTRADSNHIYINYFQLLNKVSKANGKIKPQIVVEAILAHEKTHELQFRIYKDIMNASDEQRRVYECQADIIAGYYLLYRSFFNENSIFRHFLDNRNEDFSRLQAANSVLVDFKLKSSKYLFYELGETKSEIGNHPWNRQRARAIEIGSFMGKTVTYKAVKNKRASGYFLPFLYLHSRIERNELQGKINEFYNLCGYIEGEDIMDWSLKEAEKIMHFNSDVSQNLIFEFITDSIPVLSVVEDNRYKQYCSNWAKYNSSWEPPENLFCIKRNLKMVVKNKGQKTIIGNVDLCSDIIPFNTLQITEDSRLYDRIHFNIDLLPNDSCKLVVFDTVNLIISDFLYPNDIDTTKECFAFKFFSNPEELLISCRYKEKDESNRLTFFKKTTSFSITESDQNSFSIPLLVELLLIDIDNQFTGLKRGFGVRYSTNGSYKYTIYKCLSEYSNIKLYVPSQPDSLPYIKINAFHGSKEQCANYLNTLIDDFKKMYQSKINKNLMNFVYNSEPNEDMKVLLTNLNNNPKADLVFELVANENTVYSNCFISICLRNK